MEPLPPSPFAIRRLSLSVALRPKMCDTELRDPIFNFPRMVEDVPRCAAQKLPRVPPLAPARPRRRNLPALGRRQPLADGMA